MSVGDDERGGRADSGKVLEGSVDGHHVVRRVDEERDVSLLFTEHRDVGHGQLERRVTRDAAHHHQRRLVQEELGPQPLEHLEGRNDG